MSTKQRRWTPEEDATLRNEVACQSAIANGEIKDWNKIAQKIPGRTNKDCRKRFYNEVTGGLRKGMWTKEEDQLLKDYVNWYGPCWTLIAQNIPTRSAEQCSKRWQHCLDPKLDHSSWTEEENKNLLIAVETHGTAWKDIQARHFPGRSANNLKNQYTILKRKSLTALSNTSPCCKPDSTTEEVVRSPMDLVSTTDISAELCDPFGTPDFGLFDIGIEATGLFPEQLGLTPEYSSGTSLETLLSPSPFARARVSGSNQETRTPDQRPNPRSPWSEADLEASLSTDPFPYTSETAFENASPLITHNEQEPTPDHTSFEILATRSPSASLFLAAGGEPSERGEIQRPLEAEKQQQQMGMPDAPPPSPANASMRATITVNGVSPCTLSAVMGILIKSKAKTVLEME